MMTKKASETKAEVWVITIGCTFQIHLWSHAEENLIRLNIKLEK